jgi:GNAT superfamily N-acetyltransferase
MYRIIEIDGTDPHDANLIRQFNEMVPEWPALSDNHLQRGYWWVIYADFGAGRGAGFAGMVPMDPFPAGYLKRCFIHPEHRGNGLQIRCLSVREDKAKKLGWKQLVSETTSVQSAGNFIKAGYSPCEPEQKWGAEGSMYFTKTL